LQGLVDVKNVEKLDFQMGTMVEARHEIDD
jgi:hypothetical protein